MDDDQRELLAVVLNRGLQRRDACFPRLSAAWEFAVGLDVGWGSLARMPRAAGSTVLQETVA